MHSDQSCKRLTRFGIEEEFFLLDPSSRDLALRPQAGFLQACQRELGNSVAKEMFQSQIELASPVLTALDQARNWLLGSRQRLVMLAERYGLGVVNVASHPFANWSDQLATAQPPYAQLFEDYRMIAHRSVLCGLHVHVGVPDEVDRIVLMNQVLPWLPLLLALSASSPFWQGQRTGLMSYRQAICGEWPRMGLPPHLGNEAEFAGYVDFLQQTDSIRKGTNVWWSIRPSMRFRTLELRIADACPLAEDALCIAALFRAMLDQAARAPQSLAQQDLYRVVTAENYWRAQRFGTQALFIDAESRQALSAQDWLAKAQVCFGEAAEALGDGQAFARAAAIIQYGASAQRQLRTYEAARESGQTEQLALMAVVDGLMSETVAASAKRAAGSRHWLGTRRPSDATYPGEPARGYR